MIGPTVNWIYTRQLGPGDWPSFSPSGEQVVFVISGKNSYALYTMGATGGANLTQIYPPPGASGNGSRPDWSWNPDQIAFAQQQDINVDPAEIWTVSPDGLTAGPYNPSLSADLGLIYPSWAQDLQSLVAVGVTSSPDGQQLSLYQLTPTSVEQLTFSPNPVAGRPSIGPTGLVAFAGNEGVFSQWSNQIWLVDPAVGPSAHRIEVAPMGPTGPDLAAIQGRSPNWSPDGSMIVFESTRPNPDPTQHSPLAIWVMNRDGTNPQPLTDIDEYSAYHAEWSRQQDQIVFASEGRIGVMPFPPAGTSGQAG